jgi:hypothetical protein
MGKRELVLIALFVAIGVVVYQVTAPPSAPGANLSVGGIFQRLHRSMRGARESASVHSRQTLPVAAGVETLRLNLSRPSDVTITGSDRDDIGVEMTVTARGYEAAEAKDAAAAAHLAVDPASGSTMVVSNAWTDRPDAARGFVAQVTIALTIPRRLHVTLLPHIGELTVKDVASLDAASSRGDTHVTGTVGDVRLAHIGGELEIAGGASLKLNARNSRGGVSGVTGTASVEAVGSRLKLSGLAGPLDVESRTSDITIDQADTLKPPLRFNGTGGELRIEGLRTEARIDGHNTDIDVRLSAAAPVTVYNLGAITVTAPPDGYTLDAVASEGRITSDDSSITATPSDGPDARAEARIRGGGPALTLRATRGRIDVRRAPSDGAGK